MRINLIGDNGYCGLEYVDFPVEVEASVYCDGRTAVHYNELVRIGASEFAFFDDGDPFWPFDDGEWEPVSDVPGSDSDAS